MPFFGAMTKIATDRPRILTQSSIWLGALMIGSIWVGLAFHMKYERNAAERAAIQDFTNLTRAFAMHLSISLKGIDQSIKTVRRNYTQNPKGFDFSNWLASSDFAADQIVHFGIIGPDGILKLSTNASAPTMKLDLSDREYFRVHLNAKSNDLFISKPVIGQTTGRSQIQLTRRIEHADGSFGGVITAVVDPSYFSRIYDSFDIGKDGHIRIIGLDGIVRAVGGGLSEPPGRNLSGAGLFERHAKQAAGWFYTPSELSDGIARLVSYRAVPDYPLIIAIGVSTAEIFFMVDVNRNKYNLAAIALTIIILAVTGFSIRRRVALEHMAERLHKNNIQFNAALENMPHGLTMFDRDRRLIVRNNRHVEMYGLPLESFKPGSSLNSLIELRKAAGQFPAGVDIDSYIASLTSRLAEGQIVSHITSLPGGRTISVVNRPMDGGGWVAAHEDISEKQKLEEENDRNREFLDLILDNVPAPIFVKDASERRYVLVNRAGGEFWGVSREAMIGKTAHDIFAKTEADRIATRDEQLLQSNQPIFNEHQTHTPHNGTRSVVSKRLAVRDKNGKAQYIIGLIEDVTERKRVEDRISQLARHDSLTGLFNRAVFMEKIDAEAARFRRNGEAFTVLMLDLDRFKAVNDSLGHPAGDAVLQQVARHLKSSLRETDILARLGGDEFAVILTAETNHRGPAPTDQRESAAAVANRIIGAIAEPFDIDGNGVDIGVSIGIAMAPDDGTDPIELVKKADIALYRAKSGGRNRHCFFDIEMLVDLNARNRLEQDLRAAIANDGLELHYQPIVDAQTGLPCGVEALARWRHPELGPVPPDTFIPLAEQSGLIVPLGEWVLQRACADAAGWPEHIKVAVNLSPAQFKQDNLLDVIVCALVESGLPPQRLELEITETVILASDSNHLPMLRQIKGLGISIALDDFGTGYSSLSYLTMFPFDKVKIDKSFTQNMTKRASHAAIISSTLAIGRDLGITTTAEGVETKEQFELLRANGVTFVQGYLFGKAVPAAELEFLRADGGAKIENAA